MGTVELEPDDMPNHRPDLTPWMACLLVEEGCRRKGVAGHLMRCLHTLVHQQGFKRCPGCIHVRISLPAGCSQLEAGS